MQATLCRLAGVLALVLTVVSCSSPTGNDSKDGDGDGGGGNGGNPSGSARIVIQPEDSVVVIARTDSLKAIVYDVQGRVVPNANVSWTSSAPGVATVGASSGIVTPEREGRTLMVASSGSLRAERKVQVKFSSPPPELVSVRSTAPDSLDLANGQQRVSFVVRGKHAEQVRSATVTLAHSSGIQRECTARASGGLREADMACDVVFDPGDMTGLWTLKRIRVTGGQPEVALDVFRFGAYGVRTQYRVVQSLDGLLALTSLRVTPDTIRLREGPATFQFSLGVRATRGVRVAQLRLQGPDGTKECTVSTPASGTENEGVFLCNIPMSQLDRGGNWIVERVRVEDRNGLLREYTTSMLTDLRYPTRVVVQGVGRVLSFGIEPRSVDVTDNDQTVRVTTRIRHNDGIKAVGVVFRTPAGDIRCEEMTPRPVVEATVSCDVFVPRRSEPATWVVSVLEIETALSDEYELLATESQLRAGGFDPTLTVVNNWVDRVAPELVSLQVSPTEVDVTSSGADISVQVTAADTSAVTSVSVTYGGYGCTMSQPLDNNPFEQRFSCVFRIPEGSADETVYGYVTLRDRFGNVLNVTSQQLRSRGFPHSIRVINPPPPPEEGGGTGGS